MPYNGLQSLLTPPSSTFVGAGPPTPFSLHTCRRRFTFGFAIDHRRCCGMCGGRSPLAFAHLSSGAIPFVQVQVLGVFHPLRILLSRYLSRLQHFFVLSFVLSSLVLHPHSSLS